MPIRGKGRSSDTRPIPRDSMDHGTYVKLGTGIFGVYGLQMLFMPSKMTTDHFEAPSNKYIDFWIRGQSVSLLTSCFLLQQVPALLGAKVLTAMTGSIAILYPFNAKFGYLSQLEPKYPMHYVPEALMFLLTALGVVSLLK